MLGPTGPIRTLCGQTLRLLAGCPSTVPASATALGSPDADGEHIQNVLALQPSDQHDDSCQRHKDRQRTAALLASGEPQTTKSTQAQAHIVGQTNSKATETSSKCVPSLGNNQKYSFLDIDP